MSANYIEAFFLAGNYLPILPKCEYVCIRHGLRIPLGANLFASLECSKTATKIYLVDDIIQFVLMSYFPTKKITCAFIIKGVGYCFAQLRMSTMGKKYPIKVVRLY